jgi:hypothetical protein
VYRGFNESTGAQPANPTASASAARNLCNFMAASLSACH